MNEYSFQIIVGCPSIDLSKLETPQELEQAPGYPIGVDSSAAAQVIRTPLIAGKCTENLNKAIKTDKFNHMPNMFLKMAQDAEEQKLPSATLVIPFHENDTAGVLPGQYVSELHLVIHRMPDDKELEESISVPGE